MTLKTAFPIFLLCIALTSCKKQDIGTPGKNEIWLEYQAYVPGQLTIPVGTTVTFTNKDNANHSATETTHLFDSGTVKSGNTYSYTFTTKGIFYIYCVYHSSNQSEQGSILVQ